MVNRPPPKPGARSKHDDEVGGSKGTGSVKAPRRGLEWSLRSLHSIDTGAQHLFIDAGKAAEHAGKAAEESEKSKEHAGKAAEHAGKAAEESAE